MPRQRSPGGVPSRLYSEVRVKPKCEKKQEWEIKQIL